MKPKVSKLKKLKYVAFSYTPEKNSRLYLKTVGNIAVLHKREAIALYRFLATIFGDKIQSHWRGNQWKKGCGQK